MLRVSQTSDSGFMNFLLHHLLIFGSTGVVSGACDRSTFDILWSCKNIMLCLDKICKQLLKLNNIEPTSLVSFQYEETIFGRLLNYAKMKG